MLNQYFVSSLLNWFELCADIRARGAFIGYSLLIGVELLLLFSLIFVVRDIVVVVSA